MKERITPFAALALLLLAAVGPAAAEEHMGTIGQVTFWTVKDGMTGDFEAGLKAHNDLHAQHSDPQLLETWQIVSGKRAGQYIRASLGHHWSDFDQVSDMAEADEADAAKNVDPYVAKADPRIYEFLPKISRTTEGKVKVARVVEFAVRPGHARQFMEAIGKIHAALSKTDWPAYYWWGLEDGGRVPTFVVTLPRAGWAGFADRDPSLSQVVEAEYGEGAKEIWEAFGESVEAQWAWTMVLRPDLSYVPAAKE